MKQFIKHILQGQVGLALLLSAAPGVVCAQTKEASQELSRAAKKGMLTNAALADDGNLHFTYKMKVDKKSDQVAYEDYVFDKELVYKGIQQTKENKESHPDQKVTSVAAFVGGGNSFNVMSMSLKLQQEVWERKWNYDRQSYQWGKRLSQETVKPKNNDSKYRGFASYANDDDGSVLVLASYDQGKDDDDQYVLLHITNDLNLKETKVPVKGNYSLVYCGQLQSGNVFTIFAPNKGMPDTKKYVLVQSTNKADIVNSLEFAAPSPNMLVMDYTEQNGDLYFVAGSTKSDDAYNEVFTSYAPINNPGYSTAANRQMDKYEKRVMGETFDNFHLLKFSGNQLVFAATALVKNIKTNVTAPPSQKKSHSYTGKKIQIQKFIVAPNGDYLLAGQLHDKELINKGNSYAYRYYDYVCMQFDKDGQIKKQYAVEKQFDDSKNESFPAIQDFIIGEDRNTVYWELMEVKVAKSYDSFIDAYQGNTTYTANYFPRIGRINLAAGTVSDFTGLSEKGKYLVYRHHTSLTDNNTRYYIGHDEDYEQLWLSKYVFK